MEQQLSAGLGERQIAEFVEDEQVDTRDAVGDAIGRFWPEAESSPPAAVERIASPFYMRDVIGLSWRVSGSGGPP
jgi:hypothetical protein